jgi:hypothetical protein
MFKVFWQATTQVKLLFLIVLTHPKYQYKALDFTTTMTQVEK